MKRTELTVQSSKSWGSAGDALGRAANQRPGHLVFLSARPESYKGFTEVMSFKRIFEPLIRRKELQGYPVLLLGSLRVGPTALYAYAADRRGSPGPASVQFYHALAAKKLIRFKQFAAIYPECCWIFVGDNGQVGRPVGRIPLDRDKHKCIAAYESPHLRACPTSAPSSDIVGCLAL